MILRDTDLVLTRRAPIDACVRRVSARLVKFVELITSARRNERLIFVQRHINSLCRTKNNVVKRTMRRSYNLDQDGRMLTTSSNRTTFLSRVTSATGKIWFIVTFKLCQG